MAVIALLYYLRKVGVKMRNKSLDAAKAVAAYLVLFVHVSFPGLLGALVNPLARFTVPLFFIISGYFCFSTRPDYMKKYPQKIKHIFVLNIVAYVFYIGVKCVEFLLKGGRAAVLLQYAVYLMNPTRIRQFFMYNYTSPIRFHLWFLPALLYCYLAFLLIEKLKLHKLALAISPLLLIVNLYMGEFRTLTGVEVPSMVYRNWLFMGLPFFMFGYWIHRRMDLVQKYVRTKTALFILAAGVLLTLLEHHKFGVQELFAGSVLITLGLFIILLYKPEMKFPGYEFLVKVGQNYSFGIYILHVFIRDWGLIFFGIIGIQNAGVFKWFYPVIVAVVSTVFYAIFLWAKNSLIKACSNK